MARKPKNSNERRILAVLIRNGFYEWQRHYSRVQNAIRRASELGFLYGLPGDVIEISDSKTGAQVGIIKVHTGGKLVTTWTVWAKGEAFK